MSWLEDKAEDNLAAYTTIDVTRHSHWLCDLTPRQDIPKWQTAVLHALIEVVDGVYRLRLCMLARKLVKLGKFTFWASYNISQSGYQTRLILLPRV